MSLIIRNAELEDIRNLTKLMYEYVVDFYQNSWPGDEKIHQLIQTLLEKQSGIQFVVEKDQKLIGFATLYFTFSTMKAGMVTTMNDLFLLEPYRDTDVETQLFLTCQRYTQEHGFAYMSWIAATTNKRAQQFFEKMGSNQGDWANYSIV